MNPAGMRATHRRSLRHVESGCSTERVDGAAGGEEQPKAMIRGAILDMHGEVDAPDACCHACLDLHHERHELGQARPPSVANAAGVRHARTSSDWSPAHDRCGTP
jgi:hypothetical protein